jgi:DNA uptake protein ComE-like DNA-binding protein
MGSSATVRSLLVVTMKSSSFLMLALFAPSLVGAQHRSSEPLPQPKLEINLASKAELETLPGIGPERAGWMIETRRKNGAFHCIEELRAMPRLSDRQFDALRPLIFVADADPRCRLESVRPRD